MAERGNSGFCEQCGNPLQAGDKFCGTCGAKVSSPTQEDPQVIPKSAAAAQAPNTSRRRPLLFVGIAALLTVLLLGGGAFALISSGGMANLLGGSESEPNEEVNPTAPDSSSEPPPPETTTYEDQEDALLEEFARDYDEALREEDWQATYSMLDEPSQEQITEEEWSEAQQAMIDDGGLPAPLEGVTVDQNEEVTDVPARVTLYYEDDTQEDIVAGIPMAVEDESEAGEPKRTLTDEDIEEMAELLSDDTTSDESAGDRVEEFVSEYYDAVAREDWVGTYSMLADVSQEEFTEDEWVEVQEIRQATSGAPSSPESVENEGVEEFVVGADVAFEDGTTVYIEILLPPEDPESAERLLTEEEISYLRGLSEDESSTLEDSADEEIAIEETIRGHYEAIGANDFATAYSYFGSTFRSANSEGDWIAEEESYEITSSTIYSIEVDEVSGDTATAIVDVGFEDNTGSPNFLLTWNLVREGGEWKLDEVVSSEELSYSGGTEDDGVPEFDDELFPENTYGNERI